MPERTTWVYNHRITIPVDDPAGEAMREIVKGNEKFALKHDPDFFTPYADGQNPSITMVTCSDSRVQSQVLLPDAINRMFIIRNIGNQIVPSEGSVDYGVLHLNTPVLLILGHADCGAIKAFLGGYQGEPLPIRKELDHMRRSFSGHLRELDDRDRKTISRDEKKNDKDDRSKVPRAVQMNVDHQVSVAVGKYENRVKDGKLVVVGAFYDFRNDSGHGHGRMVFININGETDSETIRGFPVFREFLNEMRDICIDRF